MNKQVTITKEDAKVSEYNFDIATILNTDEDIAIYLNSILEDEDCNDKDIQRALGNIARARGMGKVAKNIEVARESLYKSLSEKTDAKFSTIYKVIKNFGLTLKVEKVS